MCPEKARYCSECGTSLDATLISFDRSEPEMQQLAPSRSAVARIVVPVGAVVALALVGLALFADGADQPADDQAVIELDETPAPTATPTPKPSPSPMLRPTPTATVSGAASGSGIDRNRLRPVDPATLPDTAATHLVIVEDRTVHFLDMRTGVWTEQDTGRPLVFWPQGPFQPALPPAFGSSVLVQLATGGILQVPLDGEPRVLVSGMDGGFIGLVDGLAYFSNACCGPTFTVTAVNPAGEVVHTIDLPSDTWAMGVRADGRVITQRGGRVFAVNPTDVEEVATGDLRALKPSHALVLECRAALECVTTVVDFDTGVAVPLDLPAGWIEWGPGDGLIVWTPNGQGLRFTLTDDGELTALGSLEPEASFGPASGRFAVDESGVTASVSVTGVRFDDADGQELLTTSFSLNRCCVDHAMAFVTLEDS